MASYGIISRGAWTMSDGHSGTEHQPSVDGHTPAGSWWRFWSGSAWRGWGDKRKHWREYRASARPVEKDLRAARKNASQTTTELEVAEQELAWAQELEPIEVPLRLRKDETALASFGGIRLLETRKKEGKSVWTEVDSGRLYVTDRRFVFSGDKDVTFEYSKLVDSTKTRQGLHLAVSSRKRAHIVSGPTEQLIVTLTAAKEAGEGREASASFADRVERLRSDLGEWDQKVEELDQQLASIPRPQRPMSPAWIPAGALTMAIVAGGGMTDVESVPPSGLAAGESLSTTTAAEVTAATSTSSTSSSSTTRPPATSTLGAVDPVVGVALAPVSAGVSGDPAGVPPSGAESAEVITVTDGDTLDVLLSTGVTDTVRLIGIDAPEGGECMADVASEALAVLASPGSTVYLTTDVSDRDQYDRLLRYVWVGSMSVNEEMVRRGVSVARRYPPDTALADRFQSAQASAQSAGRGMWANEACGPAPSVGLDIVGVNYDPPGDDAQILNEEWIRIRNTGPVPVEMAGWVVRDESASHRFDFPVGFTLGEGQAVTVHSGCGDNTSTELFWCNRGSAIWNNDGDTAYLVDPNGNVHDRYSYRPPVSTTTTTIVATTTTAPTVTSTTSSGGNCHPSYPDVCIPPPPPDLNCADIPHRRFRVVGSDPHGFDGNKDGIGCES